MDNKTLLKMLASKKPEKAQTVKEPNPFSQNEAIMNKFEHNARQKAKTEKEKCSQQSNDLSALASTIYFEKPGIVANTKNIKNKKWENLYKAINIKDEEEFKKLNENISEIRKKRAPSSKYSKCKNIFLEVRECEYIDNCLYSSMMDAAGELIPVQFHPDCCRKGIHCKGTIVQIANAYIWEDKCKPLMVVCPSNIVNVYKSESLGCA